MAFSLPPAPVAGRSRWPTAVVLGVVILIAGVAIAGRSTPGAGPSSAGPSSTGRSSAASSGAMAITTAVTSADSGRSAPESPASANVPPAGPTSIDVLPALLPVALPPVRSCQGGDVRWCQQVLRAAMLAFVRDGDSTAAGSAVVSATVWRSIVCDDAIDCPRYRLASSTPVGSVVLEFADGGPRAWINVVGPPVTRELDGGPAGGLEAWVARWG